METRDFIHPLSKLEIINTEHGEKQVMNSWAFASLIWSQVLSGNPKAMGICSELFTDKAQISVLILRSKQEDMAAVKEAIGILAFAIDEKIEETFEPNKNNASL